MINYIIKTARPADDLKRINDYFLTFLGEIKLPQLTVEAKQIVLTCPEDDTFSVPLIRNLNLRIFSPRLKAFIPNDPNLLEVNQTNPIFKSYQLAPIFRYNHSLVFFCRDKTGKIHMVNRHLLEYLNEHPDAPKDKNFSVVIAPNIGQFIALIDRGLIPLDYYQYSKIINHSGLKLTQTAMRLICFQLDTVNQTFVQTGRELAKIPKNYLAVKVNQDVNYVLKNKQLIPQLNVSVFLA